MVTSVRGAGAWGTIHPTYRRYAQAVRFHVDVCPPRAPEAKGKIERRVRDQRFVADPRGRDWGSLDDLQAWSDERLYRAAARWVCPATGTSVLEAWAAEKPHLGALPWLPEPFDIAVTRPVSVDGLVSFEGRQNSVPFRYLGRASRSAAVRGVCRCSPRAPSSPSTPRGTAERLVLDPRHYDGPSTADVIAPPPLGRMGSRLAEIAAMIPERRPVDL